MALPTLGNYAQLQITIRDWALPGGTLPEFNANIPNFIRLAEARFDLELRSANMIGTSIIETDNPLIAVPCDWLETIAISIPGTGELKSLTIGQEAQARRNNGNPTAFAMMDGGIRPLPAPTDGSMITYELVYYRKVSQLSDTVQVNWILNLHPTLYLFASLSMAHAYLVNQDQVGLWSQSAAAIIQSINEQSKRAEYARSHTPTRQLSFG